MGKKDANKKTKEKGSKDETKVECMRKNLYQNITAISEQPINEDDDPRHTAFTPSADRKCTDIVFLLLLSMWWVGMFVIAAIGFLSGEPSRYFVASKLLHFVGLIQMSRPGLSERLLYGVAYDGTICGTKTETKDYTAMKRIYYPRLQEDLIAAYV